MYCWFLMWCHLEKFLLKHNNCWYTGILLELTSNHIPHLLFRLWCNIALRNLFLQISTVVYIYHATFNNISVISSWSVLLVKETEVPGENHPVACHCQILSHNVVLSTPRLHGIQAHKISGDRHWLQILVL
jgi:Gpi18-like mannosyltransferase